MVAVRGLAATKSKAVLPAAVAAEAVKIRFPDGASHTLYVLGMMFHAMRAHAIVKATHSGCAITANAPTAFMSRRASASSTRCKCATQATCASAAARMLTFLPLGQIPADIRVIGQSVSADGKQLEMTCTRPSLMAFLLMPFF